MPVFRLDNKGIITQGFDNPNKIYKDRGGSHTGIDYYLGHKKPVPCDNDGYVYKTYEVGDLDSNWCGVYMLVPTDSPNVFMEIVQGHFIENHISEGDYVKQGTIIGLQGNYGFVYGNYNGKYQRVPVKAQLAGDSSGSHVHESWRPVSLVNKTTRGKKYLKDSSGKKYKYKDKYCEIIYQDNGIKGYIDPKQHTVDINKIRKRKEQIKALVNQIIHKLFSMRLK